MYCGYENYFVQFWMLRLNNFNLFIIPFEPEKFNSLQRFKNLRKSIQFK